MKIINFLNKKKISESIVEEQLPTIQEVKIPDLKEYLVNGFREIREEKAKNEELELKLEEESKYRMLYKGALVTLDEFNRREKENQNKITELKGKLEQKRQEIERLNSSINTYKIKSYELDKQKQEIDKMIQERTNSAIINSKETIIDLIKNTKGNISKNKICKLIQEMEADNNVHRMD